MRKKRFFGRIQIAALVLAATLTANLTACGQEEIVYVADLMKQSGFAASDTDERNSTDHHGNDVMLTESFRSKQIDFALELARRCAADAGSDNMLVSPYSVMQALAMTANGANGQTRDEMVQVLGGDDNLDTLNAQLSALRTEMINEEGAKLSTANSIWIRDAENLTVQPAFLQTNAQHYGADAYTAPFDQTTVGDINAWVSEHTDNMIPTLLNEISGDAMLYLINAVAFDAAWAKPWEDVIDGGIFTAADGTVQDVNMMRSTVGSFLSDDHMRGFLKSYAQGYAFAALLPEEGMTPEAYLNGLTGESLKKIFSDVVFCDVYATMPQFSFDCGTELTDVLSAMGMGSAFRTDADFSGISTDVPLCIGSVQHKTHIEVDAQGTKAAAVTSVEVRATSAAIDEPRTETVVLDRPFVCMILDANSMLPVFIGTVNTVS